MLLAVKTVLLFAILFTTVSEVESRCGCAINYRTMGCYNDVRENRTMPVLVLTERDIYSHKYNHHDIDWHNWNTYLPEFTCRCAEATKKLGYEYFSLQFWGECWSGPKTEDAFTFYGPGEDCYGHDYKKCESDFKTCVGGESHNFVYKIKPDYSI